MDKKAGYTLVEIIVVVASVGLIMTAMIGVILGSFRAQNRTKSDNKITENGSWIMNELRKNVFNSFGDQVECASDAKSVQIKSLVDGQITTLSCDQVNSKIASTSAVERVLNNSEVTVSGCTNFVTCEQVDDKVYGVTFNFTLESTVEGVGSSRVFSTKVTLRN